MKNKFLRKTLPLALAAALITGSLAGCGASQETTKPADSEEAETAETDEENSDGGVQVITIGCNISVSGQNDYLDEDDNHTGSTVELMRKVDELLTDYEFELVPTSFDDVFVGMESGSYQGGEANCFLTAERIEKYAIPKENICASYIGLLVKKDLADLTGFEDVAKRQKAEGLTFYPMQAGNGLTYPVELYNEANPDNQIQFDYTSENTNSDVLGWIVNDRYDVGLALYSTWKNSFLDEEGAYHEHVDDMTWIPVQIVGVYNLFDRDAVDQDFLDAYDAALKQLKEDGTASAISEEFFGYDVFDSDINNLTD